MRCLIVLAVVALAGHAFAVTGANTETIPKCEKTPENETITECYGTSNCNSILPGFVKHQQKVIDHSHEEIYKSYEYLLLASRFRSFDRNRPGFFKVYKELSDKAWNNAIDLIKYATQRGGIMTFKSCTFPAFEADLKELQSLQKVLDKEKTTAMMTRRIHEHASHVRDQTSYDPALAHFIEEKYFEDQTETIRKLAGYANDLKELQNDKGDLSTYLFDEYLQK